MQSMFLKQKQAARDTLLNNFLSENKMLTRKTKIVCSIGPACDNDDTIREMIKAGMVWLYTAYCKISECEHWKELETQAKTAKIGLWANPSAQEPWLWRKAHK